VGQIFVDPFFYSSNEDDMRNIKYWNQDTFVINIMIDVKKIKINFYGYQIICIMYLQNMFKSYLY